MLQTDASRHANVELDSRGGRGSDALESMEPVIAASLDVEQ
jgi:hypothetical protein